MIKASIAAFPLRTLALAILVALPSIAAQAQDEAPPEERSSEPSSLDTITVTAQRRVEDVQDVPIAITTVSDEKLDILGSGGEDIRFLSGRLPSLLIESSFGRTFPRFYIRGLGNTDFDLNASQPVSLVYDEVVQENPILKGFPVFDVDQIEMLRGPQGTLFGRNTPAGVVKFESRKPSQESDGYAQVSLGSYTSVNFEGAVGWPVGPNWSARIAGMAQHRDDWVDNAFTGQDDALEGYEEYAARLQFGTGENGDAFAALFNVHARTLDGTARLFRANIIPQGTNQLVGGFDRDTIAIDGGNEQDLDTYGGSARLRWHWGRVNFFSVTGYESADAYSRGDIDGGFGAVFAPPSGPGFIPFPAESADGLSDHSQFTQEFRWESDEWGRLDWQAGFFYFDEEIEIESFSFNTLAPGRPQNGYALQSQDNQAWAVFGSLEYDVSDDFILRAGLRYTNDEKEFTAQRFQSPLAFLGVGPIGPISVSPDDSQVSWDLSGTWEMNEDVNFYARVARGFRAPSIQGRILFGDIVSVADSETVLSYEAGVKADLFDNRTRLGFTVFHYTVDDQQLTAVGGTTNFNTLINAKESQGQGFEFDLESYLTDNLLVTVGASYNDTEINDDELYVAPCAAPCTVLDPTRVVGGVRLALIDGNRLPNAPEWIANFTARWSMPLGDDGEFYVYTDWAYRSKVSFFLYESAEFTGDPLMEGGLRIGYNWDYGRYDVALFGRNILDETETVGGIDFNNLTGFVNEPRIVGVEFKAEF